MFTPQTSARIAGAAYLITSFTSFWNLFAASRVITGANSAATAANITANPTFFRLYIAFELLTCLGCVVLNAALYDLLSPVHRSLARIAAFFRIGESAVYGAITINALLVLSLLTAPEYAAAFEPQQLHALSRLFRAGQSYGFSVAMTFLSLGSTAYMILLLRSRYIPRALATFGLITSVAGIFLFFARTVAPQSLSAMVAAVQGLPQAAMVALTIAVLPLASFEVTIGLWFLIMGVREKK
jgi:Domain of unknown function (DUF4386)